MSRSGPRGFSLVGLLVTMACILVLAVIGLNAVNNAVTGGGTQLPGTVRSHQDRMYLVAVYQSMAVESQMSGGRFIVPSEFSQSGDRTLDTTANLYSAMIAAAYTVPGQLVSGNEYSPMVWPDEDYDYTTYHPARGTYWDPGFVADLAVESNVSFAHMLLFGDRFDRYWKFTAGYRSPVLGNRGPKAGVADPNSYTYGADGRWAGHIVYGDGHVEFNTTFTPAGLSFERDGQRFPDNIFAMEEGEYGGDAILTFIKEMAPDAPFIQHD